MPTSGSPAISTAAPYPGHAAADAAEPLELAARRYASFCNVDATATGLVTVSKTGDSVIGVRLVVIVELVDHRSHASSHVDAMIGIADGGVIRLRELMTPTLTSRDQP